MSTAKIPNIRVDFNWGDKRLFRNISSAVVVVGILFVIASGTIFNVPSSTAQNTSANIFVIGSYSWTLLGLLLLAPFAFGIATDKKTIKTSFMHSLGEFISSNGGLLIACLMIVYAMIIRIAYMGQFTDGKIATSFYGLESMFNGIFMVTAYFLYKKFSDIQSKADQYTVEVDRLLVVLFGYIGFVLLGIMNIMLAYFSTDG